MPVNHEDIQELKKVFDDCYVLQSDCDITQQKINNKFANDDKRIELLIHQQTINNSMRLSSLANLLLIFC